MIHAHIGQPQESRREDDGRGETVCHEAEKEKENRTTEDEENKEAKAMTMTNQEAEAGGVVHTAKRASSKPCTYGR
jgi:hypothetical protein